MISAADSEQLLAYLSGEASPGDSAALEARLSREPELAEELVSLACEEAGLREWAQQGVTAEEIVNESRREAWGWRRWRGLLVTAAFFLTPPLVVAATICWAADEGLGVTAWAADLHRQLHQTLALFGSAATFCWLGLRRSGWLRFPSVAGLGGAATLVGITVVAQAWIEKHSDEEQRRWAQLFQEPLWISYDSAYYWPADLQEHTGHAPQEPTLEQVRRELTQLRQAGFSGLYLHEFRNGQREVPKIARELGFVAVVVAIHVADAGSLDAPETRQQVENAIAASKYIDAFCFGELSAREVDLIALKRQLARLRRETGQPVTTSFLDTDYIGKRGDRIRDLADFTVRGLRRPWQAGRGDVEGAVQAVRTALDTFREDDKPSLLTFVYYPSGGGPEFSEEAQEDFFRKVVALPIPQGTNFVVFNAFDRPWAKRLSEASPNTPPFEGYTGVFATRLTNSGRDVEVVRKKVVDLFGEK